MIELGELEEIWVVAPKGFRPSQWVEMLRDFDECYDLDPHLVDERVVGHKDVLSVESSLMDAAHERAEDRVALFWDLMDKVADMGLHLACHADFPTERAIYWGVLCEFSRKRGVPLHLRPLHANY